MIESDKEYLTEIGIAEIKKMAYKRKGLPKGAPACDILAYQACSLAYDGVKAGYLSREQGEAAMRQIEQAWQIAATENFLHTELVDEARRIMMDTEIACAEYAHSEHRSKEADAIVAAIHGADVLKKEKPNGESVFAGE